MCSKIKIMVTIVSLTVLPMLLHAESELVLHQKKLSERVLLVWTGDYMRTIVTVAHKTSKGVVVIETSLIRSHEDNIVVIWKMKAKKE